jgi:hypothetical protein
MEPRENKLTKGPYFRGQIDRKMLQVVARLKGSELAEFNAVKGTHDSPHSVEQLSRGQIGKHRLHQLNSPHPPEMA